MKKTYIHPEFDVIDINVKSSLLAGSQNAPLSGDTQSNESALSRGLFLDGEY